MTITPVWRGLNSSFFAIALYFATAVTVWLVTVTVYRRFFHPLAKVPGPLLAAITHFYIVKFNLFSPRSHFYRQLEKLHQEYGPVVRISPDEIHLSDPENYEKIYYIGSKAPSKAKYFYDAFGLQTAAFSTPGNELHRIRRGALNPLFSRKAVQELEDVVQSKAEKLSRRVKEAFTDDKPVELHYGFRALAVDVITDYAFDNCYNQLETTNFAADFFDMTRELNPRAWVLQAFPFLLPLSNLITPGMAKRINKSLYSFMQFRTRCVNEVASIKQKIDEGQDESGRKTIFHQLLSPKATEGHIVHNIEDLTDEAVTILAAAADTSGHTMTIITYYIISNADIHQKLIEELRTAFPDPTVKLDLLALEKLPYLTAVIKEGLRLAFGVPGRLPRMIEKDGAVFNGYPVPRGTFISMSSWLMHRDANIFPNPESFEPARWLDPTTAGKLEKYLVAFGKGSRQCIGIHLAYSEIYITIGTIFRRFENLYVFETTSAEVLDWDDFFGPYLRKGARPLQVATNDRGKIKSNI